MTLKHSGECLENQLHHAKVLKIQAQFLQHYLLRKLDFDTVVFYLFQGAIGLPVFAAGGGIAYLVGPTAGYLYGMLFASIVISHLANLGFSKTYFKATVSLLIGSTIIFLFGIIYLGYIIGFEKAVAAGLLPFIPSELFKIALAVALIPTLHKIITK